VDQAGYLKVPASAQQGGVWQVKGQVGLTQAAFEEASRPRFRLANYYAQPAAQEVVNTPDRPWIAFWDDEPGIPPCEGDQGDRERAGRPAHVRNVCLARCIVDEVDPGDVDASGCQRCQGAAARPRKPHKATRPGLCVETVRQNPDRWGTPGNRDVLSRGCFGTGEPDVARRFNIDNAIGCKTQSVITERVRGPVASNMRQTHPAPGEVARTVGRNGKPRIIAPEERFDRGAKDATDAEGDIDRRHRSAGLNRPQRLAADADPRGEIRLRDPLRVSSSAQVA
jgi:hypothetical protein